MIPIVRLRVGKVKNSTRKQTKTNNDHSYSNQGRCKFRIKSSNNILYKSGAYRLHDQDHDVVITNSYHKYNSEMGYDRVDHVRILKEQEKRKHAEKPKKNKDTNHKKWHRNHPKDGFYQTRQDFDIVN